MSTRAKSPAPQAGQIASFRARFHPNRKDYITVRIFDSPRALRRYARAHRPYTLKGHYVGLASTWTKQIVRATGHYRSTPEHGEILLCRQHLTVEPVVHECAHIALGYARRRKLDPMAKDDGINALPDEEAFCYALGGLANAVASGIRQFALRRSQE